MAEEIDHHANLRGNNSLRGDFLWGPAPFLAAIAESLHNLGVDESSIHIEQF
ncbi:MAG: hypothetical protein AAF417_06245 [Pseudomonadota bacterium]